MATTTEYTKDNKSAIVFLNDKCIAQTSNDIENIKYNAIPSLSLFNNEMSTCVKNDLCIGLSVDGISSIVKTLETDILSTYAVYDKFNFEYDKDRHSIVLTLKNRDESQRMLSIDTTDFIKDRIVSKISCIGDDLWIYWNDTDYITVRLSSLAQIYDAGDGIVIGSDGSGPYVISADYDKIAKKSGLDDVTTTVKTLSSITVPALNTWVSEIQTYVDALSLEVADPTIKAPGIIQSLHLSDENLADQISKLRSDVSATVSIGGHITIADRSKKIGDGTLSAIFKEFNLLEAKTLRNGNTYSVKFSDVKFDTLSSLSSAYIETTDKPAIRLAHGDYITIHSHTPDPVTADNLTANIIISPEIKPFQLYSLSGVVYDLSTTLSTDISALSDGISADVTQLSTDVKTISAGLTADVDTLSDDISCKIGADGIYLSTLSILHIDDEDYYNLVKNNHVNSDTLYIVSGGYNNAYDLQVKYVAEPTDDADATTKKYVDDKCVSADNKIATLSTTVATTTEALKRDLSTFADSATEKNIDVIFNALSSIYSMISAFPS